MQNNSYLIQLLCRVRLATIKYALCVAVIGAGSRGYGVDLSSPDGSMTADQHLERGWLAYHRGDMIRAADDWSQSATQYQLAGQLVGRIESLRNQSAAFRAMGQYPAAADSLRQAISLSRESEDQPYLRSLYDDFGVLMTLTQDFDSAKAALDESLAMAVVQKDQPSEASVHNNLGNLYSAQARYEKALESYRACLASSQQSDDTTLLATVMTNAAAAASQTEDPQRAIAWVADAMEAIGNLSQTQEQANLFISIGHSQQELISRLSDYRADGLRSALEAYRSGLYVATALEDPKGMSYALEGLARLYEGEQRFNDALELAQRAVRLADQANLFYAAYRLHRQIGQLWSSKGNREEAIKAYEKAVDMFGTLQQKAAIGVGNSLAGVDIGQEKRSVLSELADQLLQQADSTGDPESAKQLIRKAIENLERLKTEELIDYFQDQCLADMQTRTTGIEDVSSDTAIIYIVSLRDRTEVLLATGGDLKRFKVAVDKQQLVQEIEKFRMQLEDISTHRHLLHAQKLHEWLISPIVEHLTANSVRTLVFVPDGAFRRIPMAALHDGQSYLIQRYAVAVTPGLRLTDAKSLNRRRMRLLAGGLTVSHEEGFAPLQYAGQEIDRVTDIFSGTKLVDQDFVLEEVQQQLRQHPYTIVHFASHGQFGATPEETFLLAYDGKITLSDLEGVIRPARFRDRPIELLVLSACQTAAGDDLAALGLAGVAVKAGARSALATLWSVHDQASTHLMTEFYRQIRHNPAISKAQALKRAQLKLLEDSRHQHPYFWSPFLIIGNWL